MLKIGATQTYLDPIRSGINDIQELSKTHEIISKSKTELWHRLLTHYLPLYFPEAAKFAGNSRSDWFLAFLERFPTPGCITEMTKQAFIDTAWDVVGLLGVVEVLQVLLQGGATGGDMVALGTHRAGEGPDFGWAHAAQVFASSYQCHITVT